MIFVTSLRSRAMAKESTNGDNHSVTKPPPTPSPLRFSKFFQVYFELLGIRSPLPFGIFESTDLEVKRLDLSSDSLEKASFFL